MIHLLKPPQAQNFEFRIGRGHECDVKINDISVSRLHARIRYREGSFYLCDNVSKFGTITLLRDDLELLAEDRVSL